MLGTVSRQHHHRGRAGKIDVASAFGQPGCRLLAGEEGSLHIYRKDAVKFRFRHCAHRLVEHDASVVHQNVELAKMSDGFIKKADNLGSTSALLLASSTNPTASSCQATQDSTR